ncbi:MAG: hypothetical protein MSA09_05880 [Lachnospiraceae bacterium]|nr:hypothetical protein [Lachnospiraceae bacterium]
MYEKRIKGWRKHIDFILLDIACVQLAFVLAYIIRFNSGNAYADEEYKNFAILYVLADFLIAVMFDSFKNVLRRGFYQEFTATVRHVCLVEGVALLYLFSTQSGVAYSRLFFYTMIPLYLVLSYFVRSLWKSQLRSGRFHRPNRSLLIVAPKKKLEECVESICARNYSTYRMISAVAFKAPDGYRGRSCRLYHYVITGDPCRATDLYQLTGTDLFLPGPGRQKWQKIQNV